MAFVVNDKQYEKNSYEVQFSLNSISALKALTLILRRLLVLFYTLDREKSPLYNRLISRIVQKLDTISVILSLSRNIYWLEQSDSIDCRICTLPKQLDSLLYEDVWSIETPSILTSVTMSVNGDFSYLKRKLGILFAEDDRLLTTSKTSLLDYMENALLYLPDDLPFPDIKNTEYFKAVTSEIEKLISATRVHMLILFISYRMMERSYEEIRQRVMDFPLFVMGKGKLTFLEKVKMVYFLQVRAPVRVSTLQGILFPLSLWLSCHFPSLTLFQSMKKASMGDFTIT